MFASDEYLAESLWTLKQVQGDDTNRGMTMSEESLTSILTDQLANRPTLTDDATREGLLGLLLELAEENAVLRDRLGTAQTLGNVEDGAIDQYEPSEGELEKRLEAHRAAYRALMAKIADLT